MDGKRAGKLRGLIRISEPHRLEEELWAAAFEKICPPLCRFVKQPQPARQGERATRLAAVGDTARRA